jgi:hypothetical protein
MKLSLSIKIKQIILGREDNNSCHQDFPPYTRAIEVEQLKSVSLKSKNVAIRATLIVTKNGTEPKNSGKNMGLGRKRSRTEPELAAWPVK